MSSVPYAFMFEEESDGKPVYDFLRFSSPEDAAASLSEGLCDALIVSVNVSVLLHDFSGGELKVAAVTQEMDLYCVSSVPSCRSLSDLLGRSVALGRGGVSEAFSLWILRENSIPLGGGRGGISLAFEDDEAFAISKILSSSVQHAFLCEPAVSNVLKHPKFHMAVDFQDEYSAVTGSNSRLPKNVLVVRRTFHEENRSDFEGLLDSLRKSISMTNASPSRAAFLCRKHDAGTDYSVLSSSIKRANYSFQRAGDARNGIYAALEVSGYQARPSTLLIDDAFFSE